MSCWFSPVPLKAVAGSGRAAARCGAKALREVLTSTQTAGLSVQRRSSSNSLTEGSMTTWPERQFGSNRRLGGLMPLIIEVGLMTGSSLLEYLPSCHCGVDVCCRRSFCLRQFYVLIQQEFL